MTLDMHFDVRSTLSRSITDVCMKGAFLAILFLAVSGCAACRLDYEPADGELVVTVPVFENRTGWRGCDYALTELVRHRILDQTPMRLSREESGAAILKGLIVSAQEGVVAPNRVAQNAPLEKTLTVTLLAEVVRSDGSAVVGGPSGPTLVSASESWMPLFAGSEASASDRLLRKLAERVVDLMESESPGNR